MKKFYNEPELKISTFSQEDVVTTSLTGISGADAEYAYKNNSGASIDYSILQFNQ